MVAHPIHCVFTGDFGGNHHGPHNNAESRTYPITREAGRLSPARLTSNPGTVIWRAAIAGLGLARHLPLALLLAVAGAAGTLTVTFRPAVSAFSGGAGCVLAALAFPALWRYRGRSEEGVHQVADVAGVVDDRDDAPLVEGGAGVGDAQAHPVAGSQ